MFCKHCGKSVENDVTFCPHCGGNQQGGKSSSSTNISIDTNLVKDISLTLLSILGNPRSYVSILKEKLSKTTNIVLMTILLFLIPIVGIIAFNEFAELVSYGNFFIIRILAIILFFGGIIGIIFGLSKALSKNFYAEDICPILILPLLIELLATILGAIFFVVSPTFAGILVTTLGLIEFIVFFNGFTQVIEDFEFLPYIFSISFLLVVYLEYTVVLKNIIGKMTSNFFGGFF